MLTFFKLLFKFLELWSGISAGTAAADKILTSVEDMKAKIADLIEHMNG